MTKRLTCRVVGHVFALMHDKDTEKETLDMIAAAVDKVSRGVGSHGVFLQLEVDDDYTVEDEED